MTPHGPGRARVTRAGVFLTSRGTLSMDLPTVLFRCVTVLNHNMSRIGSLFSKGVAETDL